MVLVFVRDLKNRNENCKYIKFGTAGPTPGTLMRASDQKPKIWVDLNLMREVYLMKKLKFLTFIGPLMYKILILKVI